MQDTCQLECYRTPADTPTSPNRIIRGLVGVSGGVRLQVLTTNQFELFFFPARFKEL